MKLENSIALVTGSTRGIGFAIAQRLLEEGADVIICSRKEENVEKAYLKLDKHERVHPRVLHVGKLETHQTFIDELISSVGRPNILVNNAASNPYFGPMNKLSWTAWDKTVETNLKAPFSLSRLLAQEAIHAQSSLSIVNISSIFGLIPAPGQGIYGMTKAALIAMTKTLAHEWGKDNIRVNAIAPGLVDTHFASAIVQNPHLSKSYTDRAALSRVGRPEEIAGMAAYLASEDARFVTGQCMIIDGGFL
jgi:NAD(P)-dependent dehydrogenase (short-subunit alcohol dehydrogenase family)